MTFKLPIKNTPNNNAFEEFFGNIADGDLFHQRYETENLIFNIVADNEVMMSKQGYYDNPTKAGIFVTHKPTGNVSYRVVDRQNKMHFMPSLMASIKGGEEHNIANNPINIIGSLASVNNEYNAGDLATTKIRKGETISKEEAEGLIRKMFLPMEQAQQDPDIGEFVRKAESELSARERNMLSMSNSSEDAMTPYANDYRICSSFERFGTENLIMFDRSGGEDIANAYYRDHYPPRFFGTDEAADGVLAEFNERRYQKLKSVLESVRKEALTISSLNSMPDGISEDEVRKTIDELYPVLTEACDRHQEGWAYFLGKSFQQIRNRGQILEGSMHKSIFGLGLILKDDDFKKAIDNGESLKGPMEKLPLLNTSKRSIINFLNNVSSMDRDNTKGAPFIKTEAGELRSSSVRIGAVLSLRPDLSTIATIQAIPAKYFHNNEVNLRSVYSMPYVDLALPAAIRKVKEKEWTPPQAFQWMSRLLDNSEAARLSNGVGDTERIIEDFYINTISSHAIYHAGLNLERIESISYRESPVAEALVKSMASTMPYSAILNLSAEVHKRSQELIKSGRPDGAVSWDPAIEKDYSQDGITITPIHSTIEMTLEGAELDHCVGTYSRSAMEGETFIFGVRDANGYRISTIEIGLDENDDFEIKQHFAASNSAPSEKESEVASAFLEKLNTGEIEFNMETNVSRSDLNKLLPIQRAEVEHGVRFSDTEVAMDALHHLKQMMPFSDPVKVIKDDLMSMRALYHDRHDIEEALDTLESLYEQQRAMGAYSLS